MKDIACDDFIKRNSLIPLTELESNIVTPDDLPLVYINTLIQSQGLEPGDFYYNPFNSELPYSYYRGSIVLDLSSLENLEEAKILINKMEAQLNSYVAKRDFDTFLSVIDKRLVPDLFTEIFNFIPDEDKFRLFEYVLTNFEDSWQVFSDEFKTRAYQYKGVTKSCPAANEHGYVELFVGSGPNFDKSTADSWTTDVNIAISQVIHCERAGLLYKGKIHRDKIISYNADRFKKEVKVVPSMVEEVSAVPLLDIRDFIKELQSVGLIDKYYLYTEQINNNWFHNPGGIHALSHTKRVLFLSLIISYLENYSAADEHILGLASIYHDIGRLTDGYDPEHGIASYEKILRLQLSPIADQNDLETLRFIIQNHAIPDQSAYKKLNRYELVDIERTLRVYAAFKDADGLDRVRINDMNPEYLRTASSHRLLLLAHQLFQMEDLEDLRS